MSFSNASVLLSIIGLFAITQSVSAQSNPDGSPPLHGTSSNDFAPLPVGPAPVPLAPPGSPSNQPSAPNSNMSGLFPDKLDPSQVQKQLMQDASESKPLPGSAQINTLPASVTEMNVTPLSNYRGPRIAFYELKLKNASNEVAIIDGDNAEIQSSDGPVRSAPAANVIKDSSHELDGKGKAIITAVSIFSFGLATPLTYEFITPDQNRKRSLGTAIGVDGIRHEVEEGRFGRRLLMPGDETVGWVAFESPVGEQVKSVKIPIWFSPMRSPATFLNLPIKPALSRSGSVAGTVQPNKDKIKP